jgi:hypothetical protein
MSANLQGTIKNVSVTVTGGVVACTPPTVNVSNPDTLVVFNLATSGYNFPATAAIVINTANTDFPYASWTVKPQLCGVFDANGVSGDFKYTCTVVETATGQVLSLDPVIRNGGPALP